MEVEGQADPAIAIRGTNTIDASGYSINDYKLSFLTYKISTTKFRVTFTNPVTKEYLFFNLEIKVTVGTIGKRRAYMPSKIGNAEGDHDCESSNPIEISKKMIL